MNENNKINLIDRLWIRILLVLFISVVLVISALQFNTTEEDMNSASLEEFTAHLDNRIPVLMKDYDIPGVNIALINNGQTNWSNAYGYADIEDGRKMTTDTYCRVESISKSLTAWGVMKLVEQGEIELDKPVKQYINNWEIPESEFSEEKVTARQLLSHSAGMPLGNFLDRYSPTEEMPSLEESLSKEAILMQEPGLSFSYSNTGFNLLELLIEEVTGRDFSEYMEQEVLITFGMHNSSFMWSEELSPAIPVGYDWKGNPIQVYIYPAKASGGLLATVEDIAAFVAGGMTSNNSHDVLSSQNMHKLYTPMNQEIGVYSLVFDSYGLGHYIETLPNGKLAVSHGGQGGGYMTHFHSVPETGDGIVILTNSQRSWPLISYILSDWAEWSGFDSVGMSLIIWGKKILCALMCLIWFIILWQIWRLAQGLVSGRRRFAPLSNKYRVLRLVQSSLSMILVLGLWWCTCQDYLMITSVFPIAANWLGLTISVFAMVLLLSSLFPWIVNRREANKA